MAERGDKRPKLQPPPGFRFDAFADARMGRSLFELQPEDWLVPDIECGDHPKEPTSDQS